MSVTDQLQSAVNNHKPRAELRKQLVAETVERIKYEDTTEHAVAMFIQGLSADIASLAKLTNDDKTTAFVIAQLPDLERQYNWFGSLVSSLRARKAHE